MCISNTGFYRPISTAKTWHHGLQLQPAHDPSAQAETETSASNKQEQRNNPPENQILLRLKEAPKEQPAAAAKIGAQPFEDDDISTIELMRLLEPRPFANGHTHDEQPQQQKPAAKPDDVAPAPAPVLAPFASATSLVSLASNSSTSSPSPILTPSASSNVGFVLPAAAVASPPSPIAQKKSPPPVIARPQPDKYVPQCISSGDGHIIVQHNYHDHSMDSPAAYETNLPARGGVTTPFPLKLHEMLDYVGQNNNEHGDLTHIISWQQHGRCFIVHKPKEFCELVLPKFFKLSKLASFQRQLNLYGFQRLTRGRDRGGYYHELFLRDRVYLAHAIVRSKVKGTGVRARSNPEQEPNFWSMPWVMPGQTQTIEKPPLMAHTQSTGEAHVGASNNNDNNMNHEAILQQLQNLQQSTAFQLCQKLQEHQRQQQQFAMQYASPSFNSDFGNDFGGNMFHCLSGQEQQQQNVSVPAPAVEQPSVEDLDCVPLDLDLGLDDMDFERFQDDEAFGNLLEGIVFTDQ